MRVVDPKTRKCSGWDEDGAGPSPRPGTPAPPGNGQDAPGARPPPPGLRTPRYPWAGGGARWPRPPRTGRRAGDPDPQVAPLSPPPASASPAAGMLRGNLGWRRRWT